MTEAVVCPLCVQWRCEKCKSQDWPDCCDHTTECEPFWPGGAVAQLTQNETCDYCAEAVRLMEEDHRRGRPT